MGAFPLTILFRYIQKIFLSSLPHLYAYLRSSCPYNFLLDAIIFFHRKNRTNALKGTYYSRSQLVL